VIHTFCRSLIFVSVFVSELFDNIEDKPTFYAAITAAYEASVKQYHNFLVRSLFSVSILLYQSSDIIVEIVEVVSLDNFIKFIPQYNK